MYLICIQTTHSQINNYITLLLNDQLTWSLSVLITYQITGIYNINGKVEIAGNHTIMQFNFRHFKALQWEKLTLFNLAYFCHPPIKPKFPSRQNYLIYGIRTYIIKGTFFCIFMKDRDIFSLFHEISEHVHFLLHQILGHLTELQGNKSRIYNSFHVNAC